MTTEPTEEQIKEFWEWCGFTQTTKTWHYEYTVKVSDWLTPNGALSRDYTGHKGHLPPIDLNNLFVHAVPKVIDKLMERTLDSDRNYLWSESRAINYLFQAWELELRKEKIPEIALFNVLFYVLEGEVK